MNKKFYVTTPIYYPSGRFHIGTAYTEVVSDSIKRYHKLKGEDTYMLTGTDEHGQKIEEKAKEANKTPKEYVDEMAKMAKELWAKMGIEYDDYIKREVKRNINNVYKDNIINIDNLNKLDTFLIKNILYNIMNNIYQNKNNIITDRHIQNIISLLNNTKPNIKIDLPNNKEIVKEYNKLIIKDKTSDIKNYKIEFNDKIEIENLIIEKIESEDDDSNSVCRLNSKDITLPLYIRNREDGDYIILKGSNNRKKIKEIFIEKKLPLKKRNNYPLLVDSNNNIIWIPNIKKSKFCNKKSENYDIIIRCNERKEDYE